MRCIVCNRRLVDNVKDLLHEEEKSEISGLGKKCQRSNAVAAKVARRMASGRR